MRQSYIELLLSINSNLGSFNKFNQSRDISYAGNIVCRIPSASTVARVAHSIDVDTLRKIAQFIYYKAKRLKMISPYCGKWSCEICSNSICKCSLCNIRNVSKI